MQTALSWRAALARLLLAGGLGLGLASPALAADWPSGFTKCANERQTCAAGPNLRQVSFGILNKWFIKNLSGNVACTTATFGDPYPGKKKVCAVGPLVATGGGALSATSTGEGTFYGATGQGNCSYDPVPAGQRLIAAMNLTDYAGSAACGEYVTVTGPKGTVTVRITDKCPECKPGDIDLSEEAFPKIADPVAGRVPISWYVVRGDVSGPVSFRYKEGSTRWWTAIQVLNHAVPITKLEILPSGASAWITVPREDYNYFVYTTPIAAGPLQVRITGLTGATLQQQLPEPAGGLVVQGTGQFP